MRTMRTLAAAALVMGCCAATASAAQAKTPRTVKVYGLVIAVNGSSADGACGTAGGTGAFRLVSRNTSRTTVRVTHDTHFSARGIDSPTFANVCVDTTVTAVGTVRHGRFIASTVRIWSSKPPPTVSVFGMVVSVNGSTADGACGTAGGFGTFTIMNRNAELRTVNVDTSTVYYSRVVTSPTFANICVDEMVGATGTRSGHAISATDAMIWSTVPDDLSAFGMVISVNGSSAAGACGTAGAAGTFTVLRRDAHQTVVDVSTTTTYQMKDVASPSFANVCVNEMVGSHGTVSSGGVLNADRVRIFARPGFPPVSVFGMVLSVNGSTATGACGTSGGTGTFTVIKRNAAKSVVDVTTDTKFRPKGMTFANVCVNGTVGAAGVMSGSDLVASVVRVHAAPGTA